MNMFIKGAKGVAAVVAVIGVAGTLAAAALALGGSAAFAAFVWIGPVLGGTAFLSAILRGDVPRQENS